MATPAAAPAATTPIAAPAMPVALRQFPAAPVAEASAATASALLSLTYRSSSPDHYCCSLGRVMQVLLALLVLPV